MTGGRVGGSVGVVGLVRWRGWWGGGAAAVAEAAAWRVRRMRCGRLDWVGEGVESASRRSAAAEAAVRSPKKGQSERTSATSRVAVAGPMPLSFVVLLFVSASHSAWKPSGL